MSSTAEPLVVVNVFTPKPGQLDAFMEVQRSGLQAFRGRIPGLRGGRLLRGHDDATAMLISMFESRQALEAWLGSPLFKAHVQKLSPLLESTAPRTYELVYENGVL